MCHRLLVKQSIGRTEIDIAAELLPHPLHSIAVKVFLGNQSLQLLRTDDEVEQVALFLIPKQIGVAPILILALPPEKEFVAVEVRFNGEATAGKLIDNKSAIGYLILVKSHKRAGPANAERTMEGFVKIVAVYNLLKKGILLPFHNLLPFAAAASSTFSKE